MNTTKDLDITEKDIDVCHIYSMYCKIYNSKIIILKLINDKYYIYFNNPTDLVELSHICEFIIRLNINFYKSINNKSKLYENIPILLNKKYSVIMLNNENHVIAIHHPENTHNSIRLPFCFIP